MRLICTFENQKQAYQLSSFLMNQGIENKLEVIKNTAWDSHEYGNIACRIWVYDEDQAEAAMGYASEFVHNPDDPRFQLSASSFQKPTPQLLKPDAIEMPSRAKASLPSPKGQPLGAVTLYTLITCILLLIAATFTTPNYRNISHTIPYTPVFTSSLNKLLMYDYPKAYELIDRIVSTYGIDSLLNPEAIPAAGQYLLQQYTQTPYWQGYYEQLVEHFKEPENPLKTNAPMFEKIREGEWWRLFTPALLHSDLFHLFFNMIWLVVLGRQIEQKIGSVRYILFILITGIFSNTAQYLMSGANFLGFSGVLCAMLAFIWVRQRKAGWEGYQLDKSTFTFITVFILLMFALQNFSFFLEVYSNTSMPIAIANTAHLSGAFVGFILARTSFFAWHAKKR
jgi:GlpG protein